MADEELAGQYLERATEAEAWAAICPDAVLKENWLGIAFDYRRLAQVRLDGKLSVTGSEQSSDFSTAHSVQK